MKIASLVWEKISRAHDVNVDIPEIGITSDIIVNILQFNKKHNPSRFDVYAKPGWNEGKYGNDIDLFVETSQGLYKWFALQSKVLKKNNRYTTLRDTSDGIMQWDKLLLLEGLSGCKGYFLLYNGVADYHDVGTDCCLKIFDEKQFGCSLVEPCYIESLANKTSRLGRFTNPKFRDIHPQNADPWRTLVCCQSEYLEFDLYSLEDVINSNPTFERIDNKRNSKIADKEDDLNEKTKNCFKIPVVKKNKINQASRKAKWNPAIRVIIKTPLTILTEIYKL